MTSCLCFTEHKVCPTPCVRQFLELEKECKELIKLNLEQTESYSGWSYMFATITEVRKILDEMRGIVEKVTKFSRKKGI